MSSPSAQQDQKKNKKNPYQQTVGELLAALATDARRGLSEAEARARLEQYGRNELAAEKLVPGWKKFLAQFQNVLVILLLAATAISAGLWLYEQESSWPYEATAIFAVVLLNAVMGYIQESRAEEAVAALRQMSAARANVVREGNQRSIPAAEVVPGDIIIVEEGDTIPADARLIQSAALQTAEAALTGESLPVSKDTVVIEDEAELGDRHDMIFSVANSVLWLRERENISLALLNQHSSRGVKASSRNPSFKPMGYAFANPFHEPVWPAQVGRALLATSRNPSHRT
jgi:Ca2+-transporting ATPase